MLRARNGDSSRCLRSEMGITHPSASKEPHEKLKRPFSKTSNSGEATIHSPAWVGQACAGVMPHAQAKLLAHGEEIAHAVATWAGPPWWSPSAPQVLQRQQTAEGPGLQRRRPSRMRREEHAKDSWTPCSVLCRAVRTVTRPAPCSPHETLGLPTTNTF